MEAKTKDYNLLLSQNKELLNKLNTGNKGNKIDKEQINEINDNENYLLKEEIKSLKEQIENQNHDLLNLNAMEKQLSILQLENENLKEKMKNTKNEEDSNNETSTGSMKLRHSLSSNINSSSGKKIKK